MVICRGLECVKVIFVALSIVFWAFSVDASTSVKLPKDPYDSAMQITVLLLIVVQLIHLVTYVLKGRKDPTSNFVCPSSPDLSLLTELVRENKGINLEVKASTEELLGKHQHIGQTCAYASDAQLAQDTMKRMDVTLTSLDKNISELVTILKTKK